MGAGNLWWALLQLIFVYVSADLWYTYIYIVICIFIYTHKHHRYMHAYTCHPAKKHILCRVLVSMGDDRDFFTLLWSPMLPAEVASETLPTGSWRQCPRCGAPLMDLPALRLLWQAAQEQELESCATPDMLVHCCLLFIFIHILYYYTYIIPTTISIHNPNPR